MCNQLRSRRIQVDLIAWHPFHVKGDVVGPQRLGFDSCGIFYVGGQASIMLPGYRGKGQSVVTGPPGLEKGKCQPPAKGEGKSKVTGQPGEEKGKSVVTGQPGVSGWDDVACAWAQRGWEDWRSLTVDGYAAHTTQNDTNQWWSRDYIPVLHGGGATPVVQPCDTDRRPYNAYTWGESRWQAVVTGTNGESKW